MEENLSDEFVALQLLCQFLSRGCIRWCVFFDTRAPHGTASGIAESNKHSLPVLFKINLA